MSHGHRHSVNGLLQNLFFRQITGQELSQLKCLRRSAVKVIKSNVVPRKLLSLVDNPILLHRRVFLGFLSGGSWLVALKTPERRENSSEDEDDLMFGISRPSPVDELSPTTGVLELWLYHPHKPIKLIHTFNLFNDLESPYSTLSTRDMSLSVSQWLTQPDHILVIGEKAISDGDNWRTEEDSTVVMSVSYLSVPAYSNGDSQQCPMCAKAIRSRSYSCVEHDCRLDIFYTREKEDLIHSDTALAVPGSVYLLVEGTMMLCIRIDIRTLSESDIPTDSDKQVLNHGGSHTVVYDGTTSDTEPKVNPTGVIDFILKCTNIEGKHLVPVETQAEYENLIKSKQTCMLLHLSYISSCAIIGHEIEPKLVDTTSWYKLPSCSEKNFSLEDWTCRYLEICPDTGIAVCELTAKYFGCPDVKSSKHTHYVVTAHIAWNPHTVDVQVLYIDRESLRNNGVVSDLLSLQTYTHKNPSWLAQQNIQDKLRVPCDNNIHIISNTAFMQGSSLKTLASIDHTSAICLD